MKNLTVSQTIRAKLDATIVGQCIDADNKRLFLLTEDVKIFEIQGDKRSVQEVELAQESIDAIGISKIKREDVVTIEYMVESGCICLAIQTGQLIRIGVSSFSSPSEQVYAHNKPLCSVKLSPDQDLIAVADVDNDIFILSADFSVNHNSNALTNNESAFKPVGVGWGSKETQFFGLDGRPAKEKASVDQIILDEDELADIQEIESSDVYTQFKRSNERNTVVDWRGDGQLLATFTYIPESNKHYLKVWNRKLELQYMSEQLVSMERGLLSWVPNGQYACTAQRRENRLNEIVMFEKNGMVHQRITLPRSIPHLHIKNILWSPDSAILAVIAIQFEVVQSKIQQRHLVLLYTMQNFHYYLKYSAYLTLGAFEYSTRWYPSPSSHNTLYIASDNGRCLEYICTQVVDHCQEDQTVAVVDANKILLTPFSLCNIPPPMSAISIEFEALVNRLIVPSRMLNQVLIVTLDNKLIYRSEQPGMQDQPIKVISKIENDSIEKFKRKLGSFRSVDFENSEEYQDLTILEQFCAIATRQTETGSEIVILNIQDDSAKPSLKIVTMAEVEGRDVIKRGQTQVEAMIKNLGHRLHASSVHDTSTSTQDSTLQDGIQNVMASNSFTSYKLTCNYFIYTTADHMLHIMPLDKLRRGMKDVGSWNQPIENGGTLVIASEGDAKVILQMPRGNLEILHPRILVLHRLMDHLLDDEFVAAMKFARRFRVDLNFLADFMLHVNESDFYSHKLNKFANDLALCDPSLLNLFIAELNSTDTTCGRYKSSLDFIPQWFWENRHINHFFECKSNDIMAEKVNRICSTIKLPLDLRYLQSRLLCLLKQEPRKSEEALKLIHQMANKEDREAALKFILYFISIEQLFADSIATYDTDIAIMVASVSSKDPKEYLALLDSFNEIANIHLRRYKMDYHNKNYEKAFTNLLIYLPDAPNKQEIKTQLLEIVVAKRIYRHAVKSCFDQYPNFVELSGECSIDKTFEELSMEIWTSYGDYLLEKRYYLEAGLAYLKSLTRLKTDKKLEDALKCFLLANDWERCVAAIERHKLPEARRADVLKTIGNNLMLQGDFAEAILVTSLPKSNELAFELVAKGRYYLAEVIVNDEARVRLREEISNSLSSDFDCHFANLDRECTEVTNQYSRLEEVLKSPPKVDQFDVENCYAADSLSTVDGSEAASVLSGSGAGQRVARSGAPSIKTRASTKSNKSQAAKRRKINLKVGSRHEDMALVLELRKFISKQRSTQELVRNLIAARIDFMDLNCLDKRHKMINERLKLNHALARNILDNLWPKEDQSDNICSVYRRFGRTLATCEYVDSVDLTVLTRPELPESCLLLEF